MLPRAQRQLGISMNFSIRLPRFLFIDVQHAVPEFDEIFAGQSFGESVGQILCSFHLVDRHVSICNLLLDP